MGIRLGNTTINRTYLGSTEINKAYLGSTLIVDDTPDTGFLPVLSNFRVESGQPTRVYFDSSEIITGTDRTGFIITDKTTTGNVVINAGGLRDHYFTVTLAFNFYDNNTIRFVGGGGITDLYSHEPAPFTLQYISNNLLEPVSTSFKYASASGSGARNGSDTSNEWTYAEAGLNASGGDTVYCKAGSSTSSLNVSSSGTLANPIKFIGYKTTPGDAAELTRSIGMSFDSAEMPLITGAKFDTLAKDYLIVKNFQVQPNSTSIDPFDCDNSEFLVFENCYAADGKNGWFTFRNRPTTNIRLKRIYSGDMSDTGLILVNRSNLVDDAFVCSSKVVHMDYYIAIYGGTNGGNTIVRNSQVFRYQSDTHTNPHGITFKANEYYDLGERYILKYGLVENCTVDNCAEGVAFRHSTCTDSVARNITATQSGGSYGNLVTFRDDANNNIIENSFADGVSKGVLFNMNAGEDIGVQPGGHDNKVINTVFSGVTSIIYVNDGISGTSQESTGNEFLNNTYYNCSNFVTNNVVSFGNTNLVTNGILDTVTTKGSTSETHTYSDFYNCGSSFDSLIGSNGNIDVDPQLDANLMPTSSTPSSIYTGGTDVGVYYDRNERECITPFSMGSYSKNATDTYPVTTSSLGMVEDSEAESLNNANKLIAGINANPTGLDVNGTYYIETPGTALTATDIILSSINGGELKSNETLTTLFTSLNIEEIDINGVTFSDVYSGGGDYRLFYSNTENEDIIGTIRFNKNIFNGNISIYRKNTSDTFNPASYQMDVFTFTNNFINNNRAIPVWIRNLPITTCNIVNNKMYNCDNTVIEIAIHNGATYEDEMYYARPLFTITDNYMRNDVDFETTGTLTTYQSFAVIESGQTNYLRNHVEGIWTTSDLAVYDSYLSCNVVNYKNNINKNNIEFFNDDYTNTLMKSKGSATDYAIPLRNYEDNHFITDEDWIDAVVVEGANKAYSHVNYAETHGNSGVNSTYIKNNTFDIYKFIGRRGNEVDAINYEVSGNTFNLDISNNIYTETIIMDDANVPESIVFSDNTFNVLSTSSSEFIPAMVRVIDSRTTNTDKIGSIVFNNNTGTAKNHTIWANHDTDVFAMTGNNISLNPDIVSIPYFMNTSYNGDSSISSSIFSYNTGVYFVGWNEYTPTNIINENITFNGTPSQAYGQHMVLAKGLPTAPSTTYRRTFNVNNGEEIYYFEFTLSYNVTFWEISFIDSGDIAQTYRMNNDDAETDGAGKSIKIVNSGTNNTGTTIEFLNGDGTASLGFKHKFNAGADIQLNITTVTS